MDNDLLQRETFRHLQEAEYNECYYRARAARLGKWDAATRIAAGVTSAGSVAALLSPYPWVLQVLAVATLAATIANTVLGFADRARTRRELAAKWSVIAGNLHVLDLRVRSGEEGASELADIIRRAAGIEGEDVEARHERTAREAHDVVDRRWGGQPSQPTHA